MLYITQFDSLYGKDGGLWKKIFAQTKSFSKIFETVMITSWSKQVACLLKENELIKKYIVLTRQSYFKLLMKWILEFHIQRIYIRYPLSNIYFVEFLSFCYKRKIKMVVEVPTYPYDKEIPYGRLKTEDIIFRERIKKYVKKTSTYSHNEDVFGIPCFTLSNGVDMDNIPPLHKDYRISGDVHFIAVATMLFWQGYERFIEGMHLYYQNNPNVHVKIFFVGEGPEIEYYKKLVTKYQLEEFVYFCGNLAGEDLTHIFNISDVGISSLGSYKKGLQNASPIKGAEYCARGLPIVCGYDDIRFPKGTPFVLQVPNDPSPIDIARIVDFYHEVSRVKDYKAKIRKYAEDYLSWDYIMKPVIDFFK